MKKHYFFGLYLCSFMPSSLAAKGQLKIIDKTVVYLAPIEETTLARWAEFVSKHPAEFTFLPPKLKKAFFHEPLAISSAQTNVHDPKEAASIRLLQHAYRLYCAEFFRMHPEQQDKKVFNSICRATGLLIIAGVAVGFFGTVLAMFGDLEDEGNFSNNFYYPYYFGLAAAVVNFTVRVLDHYAIRPGKRYYPLADEANKAFLRAIAAVPVFEDG